MVENKQYKNHEKYKDIRYFFDFYFNSKVFWVSGILLFGLGDFSTTVLGLYTKSLTEVNLIPNIIYNMLGVFGLLLIKIITLFVFYLFWKMSPKKYRIGIPIGITIVGIVITTWNLYLLFYILFL